jgi:hypothetical protein
MTSSSDRAKYVTLGFQEKLRREICINPYRKPTQVDEEKILRCVD